MSFSAERFWDQRYRRGRSSGAGSEGQAAVRKARVINDLIRAESIESVVDWGVGDGTVLSMLTPEVQYTGVDISEFVVARLKRTWQHDARRSFRLLNEVGVVQADLALSLDVIFHCIDDFDYDMHLRRVFSSAQRFVLIHSTDHDGGRTAKHVRWRHFTPDVERIAPGWELKSEPDDRQVTDFYLYRRSS